jgi:hypothetical protein
LRDLFAPFKQSAPAYRTAAASALSRIARECSVASLGESDVPAVHDCFLFAAFEDADDRAALSGLRALIEGAAAFPKRVRLRCGPHRAAERALLHFWALLQELVGEEGPDAHAAFLTAVTAVLIAVAAVGEVRPAPDDVAARLLPVLKNRHDRVAHAAVRLAMCFSERCPEIVRGKEWMCMCFELLELLRADAFACIARAFGPFDVLLALLNPFQVQERQIRTGADRLMCSPHS